MQYVELFLLAVGALVAVAFLVSQFARRGSVDHPLGRLLLGLVPAVVAVLLILINRMDLVPDDLEGPLWIVTIVLITGALVIGTSYRLARR